MFNEDEYLILNNLYEHVGDKKTKHAFDFHNFVMGKLCWMTENTEVTY